MRVRMPKSARVRVGRPRRVHRGRPLKLRTAQVGSLMFALQVLGQLRSGSTATGSRDVGLEEVGDAVPGSRDWQAEAGNGSDQVSRGWLWRGWLWNLALQRSAKLRAGHLAEIGSTECRPHRRLAPLRLARPRLERGCVAHHHASMALMPA